ncbi:Undecaprenyl pyrophosphate synthetase [Desulfocapsa sulfexigens DSM 10523]|uniref:Isoprenyl transferase n=1 Tax=Desulfocapsa sulfexigens (strain DSM 10523 / SB164P1) TaxID=1167006 RepID=M1NG38_DESSD|nr:isoprenyl transferase [Desulfocapsa sulfexigens]AGF78624.1 Undecaprenyl pyrophosphate synthetase [Desulfocapsa sulfexigens DSM 10523]
MSVRQSLDPDHIPRHVAIIMDGNGRWAKRQLKPRLYGHKVGVDSVQAIVECAAEYGVEVLTLYAFSTENWKRPADEVGGLMGLLKNYLQKELSQMLQNNIRLTCIGDIEKLPKDVREVLNTTIKETAGNTKLTLNLALSYGGRSELVRGVRMIAREVSEGQYALDDIDEKLIDSHLYTAGLPDPDLLIRTGGEARLSNFLLWQASYAEIYFTDIMWPEFREDAFLQAIVQYQSRERRYGQTSAQVKSG